MGAGGVDAVGAGLGHMRDAISFPRPDHTVIDVGEPGEGAAWSVDPPVGLAVAPVIPTDSPVGPTAVIDVDGPMEIAGWRPDRPVGSDVAPVDRADSPLGPAASPVGQSLTPVGGELAVRDGWTDPDSRGAAGGRGRCCC